MLLAGPLPLQGALNHWGRYLPLGSYHLHTVCFWRGHSLCRAPLTTRVDIYPRVLPSACFVFWRGHSLCRAPLTTGVDIYPRVLPSAYCVLLAGPLPLQGALNHWGRILPHGPTIQNNQLKKKSVCKNTRFQLKKKSVCKNTRF